MKIGVKITFLVLALTLLSFIAGQLSASLAPLQMVIVLITVMAFFGGLTGVLSRYLTQPIQHLLTWLNVSTQEVLDDFANQGRASKNAIAPISLEIIAQRQDEIGELGRSLQALNTQYLSSIDRLQTTAAEKERMETELRIGRSIQMDLLALGSATFPTHKDLALFADLQPAREVGGDFYDCFFIPEQLSHLLREYSYRLCFCIGDTSGKGVPAALFTTVIKTMIKAQSYVDPSPAKVLTRVNQIVSENNPSCMFTTLFMGVLNLLSGELTYTLAGHNPPYFRHANGELEALSERHGPPIGVVSDWEYAETTILCQTGDMVITYTDGITEAMDIDGKMFSDQRLLELLATGQYDSPRAVVELIDQAVKQFQGKAEQSDDITLLSFQYLGQPVEAGEFSEFAILEAALSNIRQNTSKPTDK